MRVLLVLTLSSLLAGGAMAQRGGGSHGGGGGFHGGGSVGGFHGGGSLGGFHGGGGFVGNFGFRGGYGYGRSYWGGYYGGYYPYGGYGLNYWPGYYDYGYPYYSDYNAYSYPVYQPSPNVTVVYPNQVQPAPSTVYVDRAHPVSHEYDEYGQEVRPPAGGGNSSSASPIYLVAMKDGVIRAAASYWVNGQTLHYVTMEHQEKQVPLSEIDRPFSQQLNRERHVQFSLQ
ncbi:conserved exported hypothetical protein [Candidatus Sulfopaludibacter sp. SbA3]|nr:conserved exported hypothetical protein [Candidatus Sulfopaludibacter sp. SbA3]